MEFCKNCMIILNYLVFLCCVIIEILGLFLVPYYRYSNFIQCLKITRIILGILLILIDCYFRAASVADILNISRQKIEIEQNLLDKTLDILGLTISIIGAVLNLVGAIKSFDYIDNNAKTDLTNAYSRNSLILLVENLFLLLFWIYFSAYWFNNSRKGFKKKPNKGITNNNNDLSKGGLKAFGNNSSIDDPPPAAIDISRNNVIRIEQEKADSKDNMVNS